MFTKIIVGHFTLLPFYSILKNTNFSSACCACVKGGGGGRKNRRNRRTDVKEEGATVERGRENRLARATKSSFDHAVKSFNMVDAFGLLSCIVLSISCTLDFVTEDGSFATHLHATNSHELQYRRN